MDKPKFSVPIKEAGSNVFTMREVNEYAIAPMKGYEEHKFVSHKDVDNDEHWVISEFTTGAKISDDKLEAVAIFRAQENLNSVTKERFAEMLAEAKVTSDLARERTTIYGIHDKVAMNGIKRIKATFIGKDSIGYINGVEYILLIPKVHSNTIERHDGTGICVYESLSAFLSNWDNISYIQ